LNFSNRTKLRKPQTKLRKLLKYQCDCGGKYTHINKCVNRCVAGRTDNIAMTIRNKENYLIKLESKQELDANYCLSSKARHLKSRKHICFKIITQSDKLIADTEKFLKNSLQFINRMKIRVKFLNKMISENNFIIDLK
jgi:hypothetical protein